VHNVCAQMESNLFYFFWMNMNTTWSLTFPSPLFIWVCKWHFVVLQIFYMSCVNSTLVLHTCSLFGINIVHNLHVWWVWCWTYIFGKFCVSVHLFNEFNEFFKKNSKLLFLCLGIWLLVFCVLMCLVFFLKVFIFNGWKTLITLLCVECGLRV